MIQLWGIACHPLNETAFHPCTVWLSNVMMPHFCDIVVKSLSIVFKLGLMQFCVWNCLNSAIMFWKSQQLQQIWFLFKKQATFWEQLEPWSHWAELWWKQNLTELFEKRKIHVKCHRALQNAPVRMNFALRMDSFDEQTRNNIWFHSHCNPCKAPPCHHDLKKEHNNHVKFSTLFKCTRMIFWSSNSPRSKKMSLLFKRSLEQKKLLQMMSCLRSKFEFKLSVMWQFKEAHDFFWTKIAMGWILSRQPEKNRLERNDGFRMPWFRKN